MFRTLFRRGVATAGLAVGVSGMSVMAFAGVAGATPPAASLIVGSGSQTSYALMQSLTQLFNTSPGCDLTQTTSDPLSMDCGTTSFTAGATQGEQGYTVAAENPYNDYAVEAPPVGSGNGISQLIDGAGTDPADGLPYLDPDFGRSSSSIVGNSSDTTLNSVEYALDGVSFTCFSEIGKTKEPCDYLPSKNIDTSTLTSLYANTLSGSSCASGAMTWSCLGVPAKHGGADPIDCYIAEAGSGTFSTWSSKFGFAKNEDPPCTTDEAGGGTQASHTNLFENQMSYIATQADAKDAIYFMSYGKFTTTCPSGKCIGATSDTTLFGEINDIVASKSTIQGTGGGAGISWPVPRGLFNLYVNSTAGSSQKQATQATLNFVGEEGFLCKANTASQTDPITLVPYRTEIEADITGQGFFPIDTSQTDTFPEGTLSNPGVITDAGYTANDPAEGTAGYCLVGNG
jgi:ABC-type phosphate transport system substrate-binding protein